MLQRIQTVYLLLAALASSCAFFLPFFKGVVNGGASFFDDGLFDTRDHVSLMAMATIAVFDALLTIFLFSNRRAQGLLCLAVAFTNILLIVIMFGVLSTQVPLSQVFERFSIGLGTITPLFAVVFAFLARKGIAADERLVRSSDRLR